MSSFWQYHDPMWGCTQGHALKPSVLQALRTWMTGAEPLPGRRTCTPTCPSLTWSSSGRPFTRAFGPGQSARLVCSKRLGLQKRQEAGQAGAGLSRTAGCTSAAHMGCWNSIAASAGEPVGGGQCFGSAPCVASGGGATRIGTLLAAVECERIKGSEQLGSAPARQHHVIQVERAVCRLGGKQHYQDFLKCLSLYSQEIITKTELNAMVLDLLGRSQDLMVTLISSILCIS